jgi:hypothetical protein
VAVPAGVADLNRQASAPGAHEVDISGDAERPSSAGRGCSAIRHRAVRRGHHNAPANYSRKYSRD